MLKILIFFNRIFLGHLRLTCCLLIFLLISLFFTAFGETTEKRRRGKNGIETTWELVDGEQASKRDTATGLAHTSPAIRSTGREE